MIGNFFWKTDALLQTAAAASKKKDRNDYSSAAPIAATTDTAILRLFILEEHQLSFKHACSNKITSEFHARKTSVSFNRNFLLDRDFSWQPLGALKS
jgi:hypothetical protein